MRRGSAPSPDPSPIGRGNPLRTPTFGASILAPAALDLGPPRLQVLDRPLDWRECLAFVYSVNNDSGSTSSRRSSSAHIYGCLDRQ